MNSIFISSFFFLMFDFRISSRLDFFSHFLFSLIFFVFFRFPLFLQALKGENMVRKSKEKAKKSKNALCLKLPVLFRDGN